LFIEQDYKGEHTLLIFNNSGSIQKLDLKEELPSNKHIILVNRDTFSLTGGKYTNLGQIYNDILDLHIYDYDAVIHWDDDDIFTNSHISILAKGLENNKGFLAYKPKHSIFRTSNGCTLVENTLEPSIIVNQDFLKVHGYGDNTSEQHLKWVTKLVEVGGLYVDSKAEASLIYNWGDNFPTFKTSGDQYNPENFNNYKANSKEEGDFLVTPAPKEQINQIINQCIQNLGS
jgi:hypothetical protein